MNIALVGYGKMGKAVEIAAAERGHNIVCIVKNEQDELTPVDVIIEFTNPTASLRNFQRAFDQNIPIVTGSTGWYNDIEQIKEQVTKENNSFLYASNFSIGVNLFFKLNEQLAKLMKNYPAYACEVTEIHHMEKKDAPSGTAITMADDIIAESHKTAWVNHESNSNEVLSIISRRENNVPGTHTVKYASEIDEIEIRHTAKNRKGFALGAVLAAEWLVDKKGFYSIKDMLKL